MVARCSGECAALAGSSCAREVSCGGFRWPAGRRNVGRGGLGMPRGELFKDPGLRWYGLLSMSKVFRVGESKSWAGLFIFLTQSPSVIRSESVEILPRIFFVPELHARGRGYCIYKFDQSTSLHRKGRNRTGSKYKYSTRMRRDRVQANEGLVIARKRSLMGEETRVQGD